jgi:hypothetical protein
MAEEFVKRILDNNILLVNIIVYIKKAKTPKEAIKYIYKIGNTIKQKREERRVNTI